MKPPRVLLALVTLLLAASAVTAQPPGGQPGDFQGGPRGLRGGPPGGDRSQFIDTFLRQLDKNGDGVITPDEVDPRFRATYERLASRAGLDPAKPIKVQDLKDALQNRGQRGGGPGGTGVSPVPGGSPAKTPVSPSVSKPGQTPASPVPAFGVAAQPVSVSGFGPSAPGGAPPGSASVPVASARPGGTGVSPVASPASTPSPDQDPRIREMVDSVFRQYDTNRDGVIDRDEMAALPGSLRRADRNGDGRITREELTAYFAERSPRRGVGPGGPGASGSGSYSGGVFSTMDGGKKSYRVPTPQERPVPKGLPSWFIEKDVRQCGQITMAEWGAGQTWTEELAAEFAKYDLNDDGIITAEEAIKAEALSKAGLLAAFKAGPTGFSPVGPGAAPTNGDGGPPRYIETIIDTAIRKLDANGDGVITADEVAKLSDSAKARYQDMILAAGRDPSQPIKVGELRDLMVEQNRWGLAQAMGGLSQPVGGGPGGPPGTGPPQYIDTIIDASLRNFDANGDGVITADEVARLDDATKARYESMIRAAGRDPSQPIKLDELREMMVQQNRMGLAQAMGSVGRSPGGGTVGSTGTP